MPPRHRSEEQDLTGNNGSEPQISNRGDGLALGEVADSDESADLVLDLLPDRHRVHGIDLKGERDLLVALGLLRVSSSDDLAELVDLFAKLQSEQKKAVLSSPNVLSLMKPVAGMPDPTQSREQIARLMQRLEAAEIS